MVYANGDTYIGSWVRGLVRVRPKP